MDVLSQYLELFRPGWGKMGSESTLARWSDWIFGPSRDKVLPSLVLDGATLSQIDPVHNLEVLLDSIRQLWVGEPLHTFG